MSALPLSQRHRPHEIMRDSGQSRVALSFGMSKIPLVLSLILASCSTDQPNIVMAVWDAARPDHMTPYGYCRDATPALSRIAERATVFEQAISAAPWTVPSVASLFTGLYVHNHGVSFDPERPSLSLPSDITTLAEAIRLRGYETALFTALCVFYDRPGFGRGFDEHALVRQKEIVTHTLDFVDRSGVTSSSLSRIG